MKPSKEETAEVKKQLGLHPIVDAKTMLKFIVKQEDIERAIPKDPQACVFARAVERMSGIDKGVAIFQGAAYVPWDVHGDGNFVIQRYSIRGPMKKAIRYYDITGIFEHAGEYTFFPPSKKETLKNKKNKSKKDRQKKAKGIKSPQQSKKKIADAIVIPDSNIGGFLGYRRGIGQAPIVGKSLLSSNAK